MSDCHIVTPLILSEPLSRLAGQKVYLKLDSLQPSGKFVSTHVGAYLRMNHATWPLFEFVCTYLCCVLVPGSFKIRGIGRTCSHAVTKLGATRLVGSSGGSERLGYTCKAIKGVEEVLLTFSEICHSRVGTANLWICEKILNNTSTMACRVS